MDNDTIVCMAFKLNSPISEDMFNKIMKKNGNIVVYRFRGDKLVRGGFDDEVLCEYWNVESGLDWNSAKDVWYTCKMYYNEVPINVSVGRNNENTQKTPAEIFKFINKMIEASKTDKTIAVYVKGITQQALKGRRPPTPAHKTKKTTVKRK